VAPAAEGRTARAFGVMDWEPRYRSRNQGVLVVRGDTVYTTKDANDDANWYTNKVGPGLNRRMKSRTSGRLWCSEMSSRASPQWQ
jgi:hypothetical protein